MALSCTNVNHSLTPQPRTPENVHLPDSTALDGGLIVWSADWRLTFEQLQNRLRLRGPAALQAAAARLIHFVAFDVLRPATCVLRPAGTDKGSLAVGTAPRSPSGPVP